MTSVLTKTKKKRHPVGLNTGEMLKAGSRLLNMSPTETSEVAESLYVKGFISYPRTESTAYSNTFEFDKVLKSLRVDEDFGAFANEILRAEQFNLPEGENFGDHPPITPTRNYPRPENNLLSEEE